MPYDLEDFVMSMLCKPDRVLVDLKYDPYGKVVVAEFLKTKEAITEDFLYTCSD